MDGLTKLATEIGNARDYGQMASAAARKLLDIVAELNAQRMAALGEQADEIWALVAERYVELPKDADGEYVHIGDVMEGEKIGGGYGEPFEVVGYIMSNGELEPMDEHKCPRKRKYLRHHHAPTVEDVLREMLYKAHIYDEREMEFLPDLIADYAKRLTLAEVEE